MSATAWIIAHKEIVDHVRDRRALLSAALYAVIGPIIAILILLSRGSSQPGKFNGCSRDDVGIRARLRFGRRLERGARFGGRRKGAAIPRAIAHEPDSHHRRNGREMHCSKCVWRGWTACKSLGVLRCLGFCKRSTRSAAEGVCDGVGCGRAPLFNAFGGCG